MNGLLQKILKCVQDRHSTPQKPAELPISSLQQMDAFENIDDNGYSNIVHYFQYVGGFHLKEAVNLCLKEAITDALTRSFTWWDREEGHRPLYNARLTLAIYEAACRNRHFEKPTRSEFQAQIREALRVAKERHRSRMHGPRTRKAARIDRDLWGDDRIEGEEMDIPGTIEDE